MQQVVMPFDGKAIEVIHDAQNSPFVVVRSVCDAIGIQAQRQCEKLEADPRFGCIHMCAPSAGGIQNSICIPLNQLNGWLFGINPNRVPESVRPALIAYQSECFNVLFNHFLPRGEQDLSTLIARFDAFDKKLDKLTGATQAVFGDDHELISDLIEEVASKHGVDGRTVWGWVQTECDVSSYKKQNVKVINFLRIKLGKGITLVTSGHQPVLPRAD